MKSVSCVSISVFLVVGLFAGCDFGGAEEQLRVIAYSGSDFSMSDLNSEWIAKIEGETVTLQSIPDEGSTESRSYIITLDDRSGELPKLVDAWYGPYGGGIGQQLNRVTVEIREWDLENVLSGALRPELPSGAKSYELFLIDLSPPA